MAGLIASCSSDMEPNSPVAPVSNSVLVRTPEVNAWSGSENFGPSLSTRAGEIATPAAITDAEIAAVKAYFNAIDDHTSGNGTELNIEDLAGVANYYVMDVTEDNKITKELFGFVVTNNEKVSNIAFWNLDADEVIKILKTDEYFTSEARLDVDPSSTPLVEGHEIKDISFETESYPNVRTSGHTHMYEWAPNYRIASIDGLDGYYIALYGYTNENNGYWDRIIKIVPVEVEEDVTHEQPETPEIGETDGEILHNNEVEVNLSVLDTHRYNEVEDLMTKLSIHVRYPKDVTVRIPVPVETLVQTDDLDIVMKRPDLVYGEDHKATLDINGHPVDLFVKFVEAHNCAGDRYGYYIEVSTRGINKDVIEYCMARNKDGLNFEIYNYYQWNETDSEGNAVRTKPTPEQIAQLKEEWLDKSTVEFGYYSNNGWHAYMNMQDYPYYYINSYGNEAAGDCRVRINDIQSGAYDNFFEGVHLNASSHNLIFVRNDIFGTPKQDEVHTEGFGL